MDKASTHGYHRTYDEVLRKYRKREVTFFEIGTFRGESLEVWRRYFTNHKLIMGLSYGNGQKEFLVEDKEKKTRIYLGDQSNATLLQQLCKENGPFDIILDDGSHVPSHQQISYNALFPCVKEGGLYMIEDIETSYWREGAEIYGYHLRNVGLGKSENVVEAFKQVPDVLNRIYFLNPKYSKVPHDHLIRSITFAQNLIVIQKGTKEDLKYQNRPYLWGDKTMPQG